MNTYEAFNSFSSLFKPKIEIVDYQSFLEMFEVGFQTILYTPYASRNGLKFASIIRHDLEVESEKLVKLRKVAIEEFERIKGKGKIKTNLEREVLKQLRALFGSAHTFWKEGKINEFGEILPCLECNFNGSQILEHLGQRYNVRRF